MRHVLSKLMVTLHTFQGFVHCWMYTYPGDPASLGAEPALQALVPQILSNSHTAHYTVDFMPFLKTLPGMEDPDKDWGAKEKTRDGDHGDGPSSDVDPAEVDVEVDPVDFGAAAYRLPRNTGNNPQDPALHRRDESTRTGLKPEQNRSRDALGEVVAPVARSPQPRRPSPAPDTHHPKQPSSSATSLVSPPSKCTPSTNGSLRFKAISVTANKDQFAPESGKGWSADKGSSIPCLPDPVRGPKASFKDLKNAANQLAQLEPLYIAQEITRLEMPLFLTVQVSLINGFAFLVLTHSLIAS